MIVPTVHRVVVKQAHLHEASEDYKRAKALGLELANTDDKKRAQAGVDQGKVVAIGPTAFKDYGIDPPIVIGDVVAFARYSGKVLKDPEDNEEYVVLNDEDLVAILKEGT